MDTLAIMGSQMYVA